MQFIGSLIRSPAALIEPVLPPARDPSLDGASHHAARTSSMSSILSTPAHKLERDKSRDAFGDDAVPASALSHEDLLRLTSKVSRKLASLQKRYSTLSDTCQTYHSKLMGLDDVILAITGRHMGEFESGSEASYDVASIVAAARAHLSSDTSTQQQQQYQHADDSTATQAHSHLEVEREASSRSLEIQIHRLTQELLGAEAREQLLRADTRTHLAALQEMKANLSAQQAAAEAMAAEMAALRQEAHAHRSQTAAVPAIYAARMQRLRACGVQCSSSIRQLRTAQQQCTSDIKTEFNAMTSDLKALHARVVAGIRVLGTACKAAERDEHAGELDRLQRELAVRSARSLQVLEERDRAIHHLREQVDSLRSSAVTTPVEGYRDNTADVNVIVEELQEANAQLRLSQQQEGVLKDTIRELQKQIDTLQALSPGVSAVYMRNVVLQYIALFNSVPVTFIHKSQREALARVLTAMFQFDADECVKAGCVPVQLTSPARLSQQKKLDKKPEKAMPAPHTPAALPSLHDVSLSPQYIADASARAADIRVMKPRRLVGVDAIELRSESII